MSVVLNILNNLIIMPIELLVEISFTVMLRLLNNCGLAIICVSLVVQTIILPLYKRADALQDEEREKQKDMAHWVNHINKTFKGDERFMMLSTYYRQQGYKSWYPLKSSFSILLQIPFFIGAYHYLSNLSTLDGVSFLFIEDLSKPDCIFTLWGIPINILPIAMTIFNVVSGIIYTKGLPAREKLQVYGLAAFFLVFLYNSPSGLVLYWTMNNLYSLLKNVVLKLLAGRIKLPTVIANKISNYINVKYENSNMDGLKLYILEALFLTVLVGACIPFSVINASPSEFISASIGPVGLIVNNMTICAGIFLVWGIIFVGLMKPIGRYIASIIMFIFSCATVVDYMGFGNNRGRMSPLLVYEDYTKFATNIRVINLLIIVVLAIVLLCLSLNYSKIIKYAVRVLAIGVVILFIGNSVVLSNKLTEIENNRKNATSDEQILQFSRTGKNVVVIMLDRAISSYVPFIFDERPDLQEAFAGFTYYPNTLAFGTSTNFTTPSLFGGYEYTVKAMNERADESLSDKHNEALLVMPRIFADNDYKVTVCDPPYAGNYKLVPDLSIYDEYDAVDAYITEGAYSAEYFGKYAPSYGLKQEKNFFYYSLMKICPVIGQNYIYNKGEYLTQENINIQADFFNAYSALLKFPDITECSDLPSNNFLCIQNGTTHDISLLTVPDYQPSESLDESEVYEFYDNRKLGDTKIKLDYFDQVAHYQSDMAAFISLANWFDLLKNEGCWDNTRIIIVSDHGYQLGSLDYMVLANGYDIGYFNPLLMVKDFNDTEYNVSDEFMTNADVPTLAFQDVINSPINPFTKKPITDEDKYKELYINTSRHWNTEKYNGNEFDLSDGKWYAITPGNIFDENNWTLVEEEE